MNAVSIFKNYPVYIYVQNLNFLHIIFLYYFVTFITSQWPVKDTGNTGFSMLISVIQILLLKNIIKI